MKILLVSFVYPPSNVIGAVRVGKLVKSFLADGHDVRVLTVRNQGFPDSLLLENSERDAFRTSWINVNRLPHLLTQSRSDFYQEGYSRSSVLLNVFGYLYKTLLNFPDGQVGWLPFALAEGKRIIRRWKPTVIYASAMPFTSLIVASKLSGRFGVPWIAEYRDLWVHGPYYDYPRWRGWLEAHLESRVIGSAKALVTVSEPLAQVLKEKFNKPTEIILNGYDNDDIPSPNRQSPPSHCLNIIYTGMIYPGRRDPSALFEAIALLGEDSKLVKVKFFGRMLPGLVDLSRRFGVEDCVELFKPVSYTESLRQQVEADYLLLLLWNDPKEQGVFTGKLFEYLGARRPIVALGYENGVAATLIRDREVGLVSNDPEVLSAHLRSGLEQKKQHGSIPDTPANAVLGFSRREQFFKLERFVREVIERDSFTTPPRLGQVLVVIGQLDRGGTENHLLSVLPKLVEHGITVEVFVLRRGGVLEQPLSQAGIPVRGVPSWMRGPLGLVASTVALYFTYLKNRPNIVHFFLPHAYFLGGISSLIAGQQLRIMSRRSLNNYQHRAPFLIPIERWLHRKMDVILGNSQAVVEQISEEGVDTDKIRLIYNGLDPKSFCSTTTKAQLRKRLRLPSRAMVLVCVANLIRYKGHADLLNAVSSINHQMPRRWILLMVGRDNGIGGELRDQASSLGCDKNVRWLGERNDVPDVLSAADIGVLASHEEGFSNSVIEAMVMGLPMVVTDVGGNSEAVDHGECGFVVPPNEPLALGDAILRLVRAPGRRREMGRAARKKVLRQFSLNQTVDQYVNLYTHFLNAGHVPPEY